MLNWLIPSLWITLLSKTSILYSDSSAKLDNVIVCNGAKIETGCQLKEVEVGAGVIVTSNSIFVS
jgi:hypothetical protein